MNSIINKKNIVKLNNNYYFEVVNDFKEFSANVIGIENINLVNTIKIKNLLFKIDFNILNCKKNKKIIKKLLFIKKIKKIGVEKENKKILGYIINYDENNNSHKDFILAINAIFYNNKCEMYNFIYDTVCDYLDYFFVDKNVCDFCDDRCGEKRNTSCKVGCCRHYKHKRLGPILFNNKLVECEYLKDKRCIAKCISCKLFTCEYLHKKGIEFKLKDIFLIDVFFNPIQKYFIRYKVFTPKEKIMKILLFWS